MARAGAARRLGLRASRPVRGEPSRGDGSRDSSRGDGRRDRALPRRGCPSPGCWRRACRAAAEGVAWPAAAGGEGSSPRRHGCGWGAGVSDSERLRQVAGLRREQLPRLPATPKLPHQAVVPATLRQPHQAVVPATPKLPSFPGVRRLGRSGCPSQGQESRSEWRRSILNSLGKAAGGQGLESESRRARGRAECERAA